MPLQQLVDYFNDRLEQQHQISNRPFYYQQQRVSAQLGDLTIGSQLQPIIASAAPDHAHAYFAKGQLSQSTAANTLQAVPASSQPLSADDTASIIHFDRLSRTVHMLNYLPQAHASSALLLAVDPRHILGIKADHGAYFEDIINKCGLVTENVVITLTVDRRFIYFYPLLLKGLDNYQRRGYQIALVLNKLSIAKPSLHFIERAAPQIVALSVNDLESPHISGRHEQWQSLQTVVNRIDSTRLLLDVDDASLAPTLLDGFDWVQGSAASTLLSTTADSSGAGLRWVKAF